jgi:predicted transposase YbfD/YdcC
MPSSASFSTHFEHLDDPRRDRGKLHRLGDILTIALCSVLAGAEGWKGLGTYARFGRLALGALRPGARRACQRHVSPRDFSARPEAFARGFMRWIRGGIAEKIEGEVALAIDGKTVRRSYEKGDPKAALHMLSAWASEQRLVLAQQKVDGKTNEIGALPDLLKVLDLQGCTVTIDAMGTQRHIAAEITEQGGDYALALKGNQKKLYREVREYFEEEGFERGFEGMPVTCADTTDIGHGRKEERRLWVSSE